MQTSWHAKYINVDGVNTHYIEAGNTEKESILLIHGGLVSSCAEFNYGSVMGLLSQDLHVIAVDVAGYGRTTGAGPEHYSLTAQGKFLIRFMEELNLKAHVAGNSLGGWLTQYIAHEAPELVKSVILINSRGGTMTPDDLYVVWDKDRRQYRPPRRSFGIGKALSGAPPTRESVRKKLEKNFENKALVTEERLNLVMEITLLNFEYAKARARANTATEDIERNNTLYKGKFMPEHARELDKPVLMTWSRENPGSSPEDALDFFNQLENVQMHIFSKARHQVMIELPEKWSVVVRGFIRTQTHD